MEIFHVVDFYLGNISSDECLLKARNVNDKFFVDLQEFQAYYYIAEYYLFHKNRIKAKEYFEQCIKKDFKFHWEYKLAKIELERL